MNLESSKEFSLREFGDFAYRKFRLYLWGAAYEFLSRKLECYRMVFHLPKSAADGAYASGPGVGASTSALVVRSVPTAVV